MAGPDTARFPLPGGERGGVRGSDAERRVSAIAVAHPHPTLSLYGEGKAVA